MPVGGTDQVVRTQVLLDRLRLGRRLDHHECLAHTGWFLYARAATSVKSTPRGRTVPPSLRNAGEPACRGRRGPVGTLGAFTLVNRKVFPLLAVFTDSVQRLIADNGYLAVF